MTDTTLDLKVGDEITIRRADTIADYRACQEAQRRAWGISEDGYLIPVATMVGANLHGGLVLGAFLPSGEAVAMSFAFLGTIEGRLCLYSQLTGVVPEYQSRGLGYQIKLFQRQVARPEGIERIAWAFDPLQAGNAHFNLTRLGAHAGRYVENMYGERTDRLNAGVPTDRLIAEWDVAAAPPCPAFLRISQRASPPDRAARNSPPRPVPVAVQPGRRSSQTRDCLLEIPDRYHGTSQRRPRSRRDLAIAGRPGISSAPSSNRTVPSISSEIDSSVSPQRLLRARANIIGLRTHAAL